MLRGECKVCWKYLCNGYRLDNLEKCKEKVRRRYYKSRYGLSLEEAEKLYASNKCCRICDSEDRLVIDHDHKTGKIRGMLCNPCNQGLGSFRDSPEILERAAEYLRKERKNVL